MIHQPRLKPLPPSSRKKKDEKYGEPRAVQYDENYYAVHVGHDVTAAPPGDGGGLVGGYYPGYGGLLHHPAGNEESLASVGPGHRPGPSGRGTYGQKVCFAVEGPAQAHEFTHAEHTISPQERQYSDAVSESIFETGNPQGLGSDLPELAREDSEYQVLSLASRP
jgi:hypothetical protein